MVNDIKRIIITEHEHKDRLFKIDVSELKFINNFNNMIALILTSVTFIIIRQHFYM